MSFHHEQREAWTLGKDDLNRVVSISGEGWTLVGVLKRVDVDRSVIAAARERFSRGNSNYLAVAVWVGPFTGLVPARAVVLVEYEPGGELEGQGKSLPGSDVVRGEVLP